MTDAERQKKEFAEIVKGLSKENCQELIKAVTIIKAVPREQAAQIADLRFKDGLSIEQIAERFGVEL